VVRFTDNPPPGLVARALRPVRQLLLASPAYVASHPAVRTPEDLMAHSCMALGEQQHDNRWRFVRGDARDERVEVAVTGRYTVNHSEMRLAAVQAGLGIACVPDFVAGPAVAAGQLVQLLPEWRVDSHYQGTAYLLFAAARYRAPKVRVLIDHLLAALRTAPSSVVAE
jgi:DNA-binding transcriptional LysR family regulator